MSLLDKFTQCFAQVTNLFTKQIGGSGENLDGINKTERTSFWTGLFSGKNASIPQFNNRGLYFAAEKIQLSNDDIKSSLLRQARKQNPPKISPTKLPDNGDPRLDLPTPKSIVIPLKPGSKQAAYDELNQSVMQAVLRQNGINPSNIEMEELMALPASQNTDLNGWLDKNWEFHDLPGLMPEAGLHKDINGNQVNGYKMTLSPKFQQSVIDDYRRIRGEQAVTPDKKAFIDMSLNERMSEAIKIAVSKGYVSKEISAELNKLTPDQLAVAFGIGGAVGLAAKTGAKSLLPVLGSALMFKEGLEQYAEFEGFALGCAKATSRSDLDRPAQEFGKWMGKLSKESVMAVTAWAGAKIAPAIMPAATAKAEQAINSTVNGVKEAMTKTGGIGEPVLTTPQGITIKPSGIESKVPKNVLLSKGTTPVSESAIPNNPQPITKKTLEHIFHGEINKKDNAVGFHNDAGEMQAINETKVITVTKAPDARGVYEAEVQVQGVAKKAKSTFFPESLSKNDVVKAIKESYVTKVKVPASDMYIGEAKNGMKIGMFLNKDGTIATAFPIYGK